MNHFQLIVKTRIAEHKESESKREEERIRLESIKAAEIHTQNTSNPPTPLPESGAPIAAIQPRQQPVADDGARIKLGDINLRLSPLAVTADMLVALGFQSVGRQGAAKLYKASDFQAICAAIVRHVQTAATLTLRKAA